MSRAIPEAHQSLAFKMESFGGDWIFPAAQRGELVGAHANQQHVLVYAEKRDFLPGTDADGFNNLQLADAGFGDLH